MPKDLQLTRRIRGECGKKLIYNTNLFTQTYLYAIKSVLFWNTSIYKFFFVFLRLQYFAMNSSLMANHARNRLCFISLLLTAQSICSVVTMKRAI